MSYSQNDEEEFILKFFNGKIGTCCEIGAFDGKQLSNTRALIEAGWKGVWVEPDPRNLVALKANMTADIIDRVQVFAAAVTGEFMHPIFPLLMDETPDRGWASTIVDDGCGVIKKSSMNLWVPTIRFTHLYSLFGPFQFLSIDAEHADFGILKSAPPGELFRGELICVEPKNLEERKEMIGWFYKEMFKVVHETPENLLVAKR